MYKSYIGELWQQLGDVSIDDTTHLKLLEDIDLINLLIDRVYHFIRMYWKSVSQQNLPVTIKCPEMLAEIYPYFKYDKLPDFGRKTLWFL